MEDAAALAAHAAPIADPMFDRYARLVRDSLGASIALVSLIGEDSQLMPGSVGLQEPWQSSRRVPLDRSVCRHVAARNSLLVIEDAHTDDSSPPIDAMRTMGLRAYAGFPLRDADGDAIGAVCAVDWRPREWTDDELALLRDISAVCSTEVALRQARDQLALTATESTALSRRLQLLLGLSEALAEATTAEDVAHAVHEQAARHLQTLHAGAWVVDPADATNVSYVRPPSSVWELADKYAVLSMDSQSPVGAAVLDGVSMYFADRAAQDDRFPDFDTTGTDAEARAFLPLRVGGRVVGTLILVWETARQFNDDEQLAMRALTAYTAQAVQRTSLIADRTSAARTLQLAMLTRSLPQVPGLSVAGRYVPADARDEVGGDWYDASRNGADGIDLMIGDVAGHDLSAAAVMGELRNILRTLAWLDSRSPAEMVFQLDAACHDFGIERHSTLIYGRLERTCESTGYTFRYSNAGHVPPLLVLPSGETRFLETSKHDPPLNVVSRAERLTHEVHIETGGMLLLFTDGLVETRTQSLNIGLSRLARIVATHADQPLAAMLDRVLAEAITSRNEDDVAVLAVRCGN